MPRATAIVAFCDDRGQRLARLTVLVRRGPMSSAVRVLCPLVTGGVRERAALVAHDGGLVVWLNNGERLPIGAVPEETTCPE